MTKQWPRIRLGLVLAAFTLLSFLLGVCAYIGLNMLTSHWIDKGLYSQNTIINKEKELLTEFVEYMNDNDCTLFDRKAVQQWVASKPYLMVAVYNANGEYFQNDEALLYSTVDDAPTMYNLLQSEYSDYWYSALVNSGSSRRRSQVVRMMYYPMYRARTYAKVANLSVSFVLFVGVLMTFIHKKTKYIATLSSQLQVMQSGELGIPMMIKGNDDLTTLACDIEEMRKSFIERLEHEEAMAKNASELLTAMSHDLRTPLTSLLGYLDIIDLGKYENDEQRTRYIRTAKSKAYQIKEMTDKLFEYFLVYSPDNEKMETESMDAAMLMSQLWEESALALETDGFSTEIEVGNETCTVEANVSYLKRVFDNIVSNIRKYADRDEPVHVKMGMCGQVYFVEICNGLAPKTPHAESSGIGLSSCRKVMERHGGSFENGIRENMYFSRLNMPVRS